MAEIQGSLERVNCALCGNNDTAMFVRASGAMQIVRCLHDGLIYVNPRYTKAVIADGFRRFVQESNRLTLLQRGLTLRREAAAIRAIKRGGDLLDIGCATGVFFENFSESHWRLFGVESCDDAVEFVRDKYHANVLCGDLVGAGWPAESFDVITILDTLYYFPDPLDELLEVNRLLRPDGILAIEIPGLFYKLLRERGVLCWLIDGIWSRLKPESMHLYHYSKNSLRLLLEKAGFAIVQRLPQQSPLGRSKGADAINSLHFGLAKMVSRVSGAHLSIAAKEFYLCRKR